MDGICEAGAGDQWLAPSTIMGSCHQSDLRCRDPIALAPEAYLYIVLRLSDCDCSARGLHGLLTTGSDRKVDQLDHRKPGRL